MALSTTLKDWFGTLWMIVTWPFRQLWGAAKNVYTYFIEGLAPKDLIVTGIRGTVVWIINQGHQALGWASPGDQVVSSVGLAVFFFFTGAITGGAAWAIIGVWAFTGFVGLLRFIPVVNKYWPLDPSNPPALITIGVE